DGRSWGSLTLEPGTYILSCNGGGAMGLMSASVCVEFSTSSQLSSPPTGGQAIQPDPQNKEKPSNGDGKPPLPTGPIEQIIIRPKGDSTLRTNQLDMKTGDIQPLEALGVDPANPKGKTAIVKEWRLKGYRHEETGSIDNNGVFKAGPKVGKVTIMATVENKDGNIIVGAFFITVSDLPPITIEGCVKLYDINKKKFYPPGGAVVDLSGETYNNLEDLKKGQFSEYWIDGGDTQIDPKSCRFKFVVKAHVDEPFVGWKVELKDPPTTSSAYYWTNEVVPSSQAFSNEANTQRIIKPGERITIAPKGINCFKLWLKKKPASFSHFINGEVRYRGQPVKNVNVRLFSYGKIVKKTLSDKYGKFSLDVSNLPRGRYILTTARHEPKKPSETKPFVEPDPLQVTTVDTLLYPKKEIPIQIPLKTETKNVIIEMISFAQKIGYRGI
ncbi:hypothetical protein KAI46_08985, partial [bacterium]|nr:hypothetical protein [bacterium]